MDDVQLKKMDRMMSILTNIQSRKLTTAQYLSEKFEVSLRTIYRDIKTLISAGIPIIGESGSGYSLMEGYKLPPIMFTLGEAMSFVAAEKLVEKYLDNQLYNDFNNAIIKIKAILKWNDKIILENLNERILTKDDKPIFNKNVPQAMSFLIDSIAQRKILKMKYLSIKSEVAIERKIEPVGVYHQYGYWYIYAWDSFRNEYRNFRTDRIQDVTKLDIPFNKEHPTLVEYLNNLSSKEQYKEISFRIHKDNFCFIQDAQSTLGAWELKPSGSFIKIKLSTPTWNITNAIRYLTAYGDMIDGIEPEDVRNEMLDLLSRIKIQQISKS